MVTEAELVAAMRAIALDNHFKAGDDIEIVRRLARKALEAAARARAEKPAR